MSEANKNTIEGMYEAFGRGDIRDGKVVKFQQYTDTAQFQTAVDG